MAFSDTEFFRNDSLHPPFLGTTEPSPQTTVLDNYISFKMKPMDVRFITEERLQFTTKSTDSLNKFIALRMSEVPNVERVYSKYSDNVFYTWTVIEKRDKEVLRQIYQRQKGVIRRFGDFGFDFYVIYRDGADINSLLSGDLELVYERR